MSRQLATCDRYSFGTTCDTFSTCSSQRSVSAPSFGSNDVCSTHYPPWPQSLVLATASRTHQTHQYQCGKHHCLRQLALLPARRTYTQASIHIINASDNGNACRPPKQPSLETYQPELYKDTRDNLCITDNGG